ncbi:hypothetical protein [Paenibacillus sp. sgz500958]
MAMERRVIFVEVSGIVSATGVATMSCYWSDFSIIYWSGYYVLLLE